MACRKRTVKEPAKPGTRKRSVYIEAARQVVAERNARTLRDPFQQSEEVNPSQTVDSKQSTDKKER